MAHSAVPGEEFCLQCLERARALPDAERSADVAAFLHCHDALEAAAPFLPALPASGRALTQPLGGAPALAALLQFVANQYAAPPDDVPHPHATLRYTGPQLPPLMQVWAAAGSQVQMMPQPLLADILTCGRLPEGEPGLDMTARLLLVAIVSLMLHQVPVGVDVLQVLKPALLGEAAAARLDRQLAQLRQQLEGGSAADAGASGGSSSTALPTARQLQVAWHVLALLFAKTEEAPQCLPPARVSAVAEEAARGLLQLEPDNPRSSFALGTVATMNYSLNPASQLRDPLPHFLRCVELARQQRNDYFLARGCWMAAVVAASDASPAVTPAQAAALVEEASGAFQRCRHVVPPNWASYMKIDQAMASSQRANIQAHVAASPDRWQHGILSRQQPEVRRRADRVLARHDGGQPTCDACGLPSVALKRCSRCKSTRYCSTDCQARHWKSGHKQECQQLVAERAGGSGAAANN